MMDALKAAGRFVSAPVRAAWNAMHVASNVLQLAVSISPIGMVASKLMTGEWTKHAKVDVNDLKSDGGHFLAAGAQTVAIGAAPFTMGASLVPGFAAAYAEQRLSKP